MPKPFLTVPHHKQKANSDCLATCAAMCLAYLEINVSYQKLLRWLDVAPWGTPHRHIQHLEKHLSTVRVRYQQGGLTNVFTSLDNGYPVIIFLWTGELPYWHIETWHALVVIGYDDNHFWVNDPAMDTAPHKVSHGDLDLAWLAHDTYYAVIEQLS